MRRNLLPAALVLLLVGAPIPTAAEARGAACTGRCWQYAGSQECPSCGFSAFLGGICDSGTSGGICWCTEYECPNSVVPQTSEAVQVSKQEIFEISPASVKVLRVRELVPRT